VRSVIDEAHDEARQAIAELKYLARGLRPAVLDARGRLIHRLPKCLPAGRVEGSTEVGQEVVEGFDTD
jgi:signal transduction histidine kinase